MEFTLWTFFNNFVLDSGSLKITNHISYRYKTATYSFDKIENVLLFLKDMTSNGRLIVRCL